MNQLYAMFLAATAVLVPVLCSAQAIKLPVVGVVRSGYGSRAGSGVTTLYTVPAGKVFLLSQFCAVKEGEGEVKSQASLAYDAVIIATLPYSVQGCQSYDPGLIVPAGKGIVGAVNFHPADRWNFSISGIEMSAP